MPGLPPSPSRKHLLRPSVLPKKVASANTFEIQSSELAKDRAQSGDVKSFAEQMIKDYTRAGNDFKSAVAAANILPPPPEEPDAQRRPRLPSSKALRVPRSTRPT